MRELERLSRRWRGTIVGAPTRLDELLPAWPSTASAAAARPSAAHVPGRGSGRPRLRVGAAWPRETAPPVRSPSPSSVSSWPSAARRSGEAAAPAREHRSGARRLHAAALVVPLVADDEARSVPCRSRLASGPRVSMPTSATSRPRSQARPRWRSRSAADRPPDRTKPIKDLFEDLHHQAAPAVGLRGTRPRPRHATSTEPHVVTARGLPGRRAAAEPPRSVAAGASSCAGARLPRIAVRPPRRRACGAWCPAARRRRDAGSRNGWGTSRPAAPSATAGASGVSNPCDGVGRLPPRGFEESAAGRAAAAPVSAEPGAVSFDDLGAYKYLLRVAADDRVRDRHGEALRRLPDYDRGIARSCCARWRSSCASAATSRRRRRRSYVHPNTLRQRLRRIAGPHRPRCRRTTTG